MKSMASCVLARMSLSWSTLKHPLCGHPGILWPCWSLLIGTVSNFAWGAMLRPANSLFPACCCARPIPRWYFAAICTCSQVGIANIFQLKQLKHCSEVGLLHEASEVILLLSKTALYTWWAHHRVISSHIESYRVISSQSCVFSPCFLPGDSGCLGMQAIPWSWRCTRMLCWQLCSLQGRGGQSENRFVRIDAGNLNSYIINQINLFRSFMFNQIKILINLGPSNSF